MPPLTRSGNLLQCFDEQRYFMPPNHNRGYQCIAPTARGNQCTWDISKTELYEIARMTCEYRNTRSDEVKLSILERIILLRVCGDVHREKLQEKFDLDLDCRNRFIRRYRDLVTIVALSSRELEQEFAIQIRQSGTSPLPRTDRSGNIRYHHLLPPRVIGSASRPVQPWLHATQSIFVPYYLRPQDSMNTVLKQSIPYGYVSQGYVYALTWPAVPGYIKIGYTRNTVESRRAELEYCQPGIQFLHAVDVAFPKRVERLLHLELSSTRHQITICPQCAGTHYEWFRIPETTAIRTLSAWRTLSEDNGLYSTSRQLLLPWIRRVDDLDSPATAQALLSIRTAEVQAEAAVQAAARYAAREVHERVEAVAHAEALRIQAACASAQMVKEQAQAEALRVQAARLMVRMFEEKTRADALRVQAAQNIALVDAAESLVRNEMTGTAGQVETVDRKPAKIRSGTPKELNLDTILDAFRDFGRMVMINIP